ncbi:MAG: ABC transporter ATP-binding protein [Lachnospiraceae bacterium]|nr:ABC transporter ATP-binding protein [Lachnospiraceae bacterium]
MGQDKIALRTDKLSVGYEKNIIVKEMNLSVKAGSVTSIIGPNGAGKSTFLKTLAGYIEPLGGMVYLDDASLFGMSDHARSLKMSVLMTDKVKVEWMKVFDIASMGRYPYTGSMGVLSEEDIKKTSEVIELVGLSALKERYFNELSDGQKQRVMFARAIIQEPKILVLDEPSSFLDMKYKLEMLSIIRKLSREDGVTVIMTLHELEMARQISDMLICIKDGCIECCGTPEEVFAGDHILKLYEIDRDSEFLPEFLR